MADIQLQNNNLIKSTNSEYVDSLDYTKWQEKIEECVSVMGTLQHKSVANRKLRYADLDIEKMRKEGKLAPDEIYVPRHIIESNIRREQSSYIQYVSQSPRAVVLVDKDEPTKSTSMLEHDITNRVRFSKWQLSMYALIDAMQQDGYGIMEVVQDLNQPGELAHEHVQLGDFSFISDTRDIQEAEIVMRAHYFTKTKLVNLTKKAIDPFNSSEVEKVISNNANDSSGTSQDVKERSLYKIYKVMFRSRGIVMTAWCANNKCDKWIRDPRPLTLGRQKQVQTTIVNPLISGLSPVPIAPKFEDEPESNYPYFIAPYLISENNTISQLRGRAYLDQDSQEAASSLLSSFCTGHRRASGLYFSKDVSDPNADVLMQKDVFFRTGALINSKVTQFQVKAPESSMANAISMIETMNQSETSQVNFAVSNRKDSRKTAKEVSSAEQQQQNLSTVQVVLFSTFIRDMYNLFFTVIKSRVTSGLISVNPALKELYARNYALKASGDSDVIEKQQLVSAMMNAWPVIKETPANVTFLCDLITKMFPETGMKYANIINQAQQQQQQQQVSQQAALAQKAQQLALQVVELSKHPEMFSETGKIYAFPAVQIAAKEIEATGIGNQ